MPSNKDLKFSEEDLEARVRQLLRVYLPESKNFISTPQTKSFIKPPRKELRTSSLQTVISSGSTQPIRGFPPKGKNIVIQSLHHPDLKLLSPIWIYLEYDGEQFIAVSYDFNNIYGVGGDETEALEDFRESIAEFYFDLKEKKLGEGLQRIFDDLQEIIQEKG